MPAAPKPEASGATEPQPRAYRRAYILPLATIALLLAADPLIARAVERHPQLGQFAQSPWLWFWAVVGGIVLSMLAAVGMLGLMILGGKRDGEGGK